MKEVILALLAVAVVSVSAFSQSTNVPEQDRFCGDAPDARHTPDLPQAVVSAVMVSDEGKEARAAAERKRRKFNPTTMLKGVKIDLGAAADAFYLVVGSPTISGPENTWFWVVRQSGNKAEVLLWASGRCLVVSKKRTLGFRDVEVTFSSAGKTVTEIYRYNGSEYKVWRHKSPLTEVPFIRR